MITMYPICNCHDDINQTIDVRDVYISSKLKNLAVSNCSMHIFNNEHYYISQINMEKFKNHLM